MALSNVRQYVGARYVPKFFSNPDGSGSNTWIANQSYEALTIVLYNNTSYTSKIPVPATVGNPADNPNYWVITGNYNGQVEGYHNDVIGIEEQFNDLKSSNETFKNQTNNTIATNNAKVDALTSMVSHNNANRRFIFVGDSYGDGYTPEGTVRNWCLLLKDFMHLDDNHCYIVHQGGKGFTTGNITFTTLIKSLENTVENKDGITDIVVCGGFNDKRSSSTSIGNGIKEFCNYCKTTYKNAEVWIGAIGMCITGITTGSHSDATSRECFNTYLTYYRDSIINNANFFKYGIYWAKREFFGSDYVHPNGNGQYNIAYIIGTALLGNPNAFFEYESETMLSTKLSENVKEAPAITAEYTGDMFTAHIAGTCSFINPITINKTENIKILDAIYDPVIMSQKETRHITIPLTIHTTEKKYYICLGNMNYGVNGLSISAYSVNSEHTDYKVYENVDYIVIPEINFDYGIS